MNYLRNRFSERSTHFGLGALGVALACLIFPEYAAIIQGIAAAAGVGAAVIPTSAGK